MNVGFSSRNLKYSLSDLSDILLMSETETESLCRQCGLECANGTVKFFKGSLKDDVTVGQVSTIIIMNAVSGALD